MPKTIQTFDFAVIGAGIAGTGVAGELAADASVVLIEAEARSGYHSTGRSAAMFAPGYGPGPIRALTRASQAFFDAPPVGFADTPLLSQRDVVMISRPDQSAAHAEYLADLGDLPGVSEIDGAEVASRLPLLRPGYAAAGVLDTSGSDIDVDALLQGFARRGKARGVVVLTKAPVRALTRQNGLWHLQTDAGEVRAEHVINAAGAWAGEVGQMAGAEDLGLVPKRRTALIVDAPVGLDVAPLPLAVDIEEQFYMKPDAGRLLISPANEDPMPPCDVQPDEMDIAVCVDRIQTAFDLDIRRIDTKWAGLRSFVADKSPVAGYSQMAEGFFWLAGQGGYGVQSSPALSRTAAALAMGQAMPDDVLAQGLDPASLSPARLAG